MLVEEVDNLLAEQLSLEHVLNDQFVGVFDEGGDLPESSVVEDGVGLDEGDCEGEVDLFGVEENLIHSLSYIL